MLIRIHLLDISDVVERTGGFMWGKKFNKLPIPPLQHVIRKTFYFTEKGFQKFGAVLIYRIKKANYRFLIIFTDEKEEEIMYRDEFQVATPKNDFGIPQNARTETKEFKEKFESFWET